MAIVVTKDGQPAMLAVKVRLTNMVGCAMPKIF